jgi:sulfate/thiosulfate transport system substrate-binding protein
VARARTWTWLPVLLSLALVLAACGGDDDDSSSATTTGGNSNAAAASGTVNLVAYSTPQEAYGAIEKEFKKTNPDVKFTESYGASGDQSRAVESGQKADYVAFSLEPDITRLTKKGIVAGSWNQNDTKGMVTNSVVVLVTRKGNPKHIKGWEDITKPGVGVIVPNVFTSGGARWDVMAAYGSQIKQGKSEAEATQYLHDLYKNVKVQDDSARKSLTTFTGGAGDVLLAYENEAIFAQQQGAAIDYVVPDQTILIENPVALTVDGEQNAAAKAFYDYVFTEPAQEIFAKNGYRPIVKDAADAAGVSFPAPKKLFTIQDFGGWPDVMTKFFDPDKSIMADVERGIGVSTGK